MPPKDSKALQSAYEKALKLQQAGQDDQALAAYAAIVDANPNIAEVHFQIARIFLRNDRLERGLRHVKAAARLKPNVNDIWSLWCELVMSLSDKTELEEFTDALAKAPVDKRHRGDLKTAAAFKGKTKVSIAPIPNATFANIVDAVNANELAVAEERARETLKRYPEVAALHDLMTVILLGQKRWADAVASAETAIRTAPRFADARANLARALKGMTRAPEGVRQSNLALRLSPGLPAALKARAECYLAMGFKEEAKKDLRRLIDVAPKDQNAYQHLATLLQEEDNLFEAFDVLEVAQKKGLLNGQMRLMMATILADIGETERAVAQLETVLEETPENENALVRLAELLQTLGEFGRADATFNRAISANPDRGQTYRVQLTSKKLGPEDPLVAEMDRKFRDDSIPGESRAHFGFALAKVMEDAKIYDRVFEYLRPANDMIHTLEPYDLERRRTHDHRVMDSLRKVDWAAAPANEKSDFAPIFITGMPRSGTTLVEQIIASHSTVTGAGEVGVATKRSLRLFGDEEGRIAPADTVGLPAYAELAEWYETYMRRLHPGADRITDKSIQTYNWIGPLRRAMPKSRFVVVRRDPRDNLLSIYKNVFPENGHLYSYHMPDLVAMYQLFVEWVEFWRELTPEWFYEVHYESLVANPEEEARKLIAACDLEWEDGCLEFYKNDRRVKTLSVYQVRQPMYQSSTKAWQRYRADLDDLFEALGPEYSDAAE